MAKTGSSGEGGGGGCRKKILHLWVVQVCALLVVSRSVGLLAVEVNDSEQPLALAPHTNATLKVLRCCRENEDLDKPRPDGQVSCVPSAQAFRPEIYSPTDGDYLPELPDTWHIVPGVWPACHDHQVIRYVPRRKSNPYFLFESGTVLTELDAGVELEPHEYCLGSNALLACMPMTEGHPAAATMKPRLRKCCGPNAAYDKNACVESAASKPGSLENEKTWLLGTSNANSNASMNMELVSNFPPCRQLDNFTIIGDMGSATLQPDASLLVKGQMIPAEEFCIERLRVDGKEVLPAKVFACSEHASTGADKSKGQRDIRFTLYPIGLLISSVFLAATLAAGWLLPASHHLLHWRCQTHHVACLMLGDICMAIIQLAGDSLGKGEYCRAIAILAHFFFLATFFWLNTMCFNIWWTFRDLRPASLEKSQELIRLRFYAAYAWGGPLIIAGLAAILDHWPQVPGQTFLRPRFGETQCWFVGDMEIFAYFYGPIGVLLAINLLFFAATAFELTCGLWKGDFAKSTTERAALGKVCLKLVIVMGVPWIFDVISWWIGGPNFLWYVTDLLNALQGVFIFIVVGCQPHVRAALKRLWSRNPRANANRQGNNGLSTTSHGIPSLGDSVTQNPSTKTAPLETIC